MVEIFPIRTRSEMWKLPRGVYLPGRAVETGVSMAMSPPTRRKAFWRLTSTTMRVLARVLRARTLECTLVAGMVGAFALTGCFLAAGELSSNEKSQVKKFSWVVSAMILEVDPPELIVRCLAADGPTE